MPVVTMSAGSRATIKDQSCYFQMPDFVCLAWRCEFAGTPTSRLRREWGGRNDVDLDVIAFGAFEQPAFEADWPRRNALQQHPRSAAGTARAFNRGQELLG
jgi:hypothetical protein